MYGVTTSMMWADAHWYGENHVEQVNDFLPSLESCFIEDIGGEVWGGGGGRGRRLSTYIWACVYTVQLSLLADFFKVPLLN